MKEGGLSSVFDVMIFALLVSSSTIALTGFEPVDDGLKREAYASGLARSTMLALQNSSVVGVGGVEYELEEILLPAGLGKRELEHKTFTELLAEDAFLNLTLEAAGENLRLGARQNLNQKLGEALRKMLDRAIGGRFGYRFTARTSGVLAFEKVVENLDGVREQLCSETLFLPLLDAGGIETPTLEVNLELWSR